MPDEPKPKGRKKVAEPEAEGGVPAPKAKAKGAAAGKTAEPAVVVEPVAKPHTVSTKTPKLAKKNKHRLPRRQKKAQQKAAAAQARV
jgi:hypothetical protein